MRSKKITLPLITSISGIRGTIGEKEGENLTRSSVIKFTNAFAQLLLSQNKNKKIVIGRDARESGEMFSGIVTSTLQSLGFDVVDLGLSTTPTVEMAVTMEEAGGGIIITASHNPKEWNALKLLNEKGEFISAKDGQEILRLTVNVDLNTVQSQNGTYTQVNSYIDRHIEKILQLDLVNKEAIKKSNFKIIVDAVNSSGGIAVPRLLKALGVETVIEMYCEPNGKFPHNPEPLPENLTDISNEVKRHDAHVGIVVDPDVDRLSIICEDGSFFGEEYTLVAVADYILQNKKGNTVSNLSSTRALRDITEKLGGKYFASAVGEVNVVEKMKEVNAIIGGEGNGGVIYPELHYGRDALAGIALFLSHLASSGKRCSVLRSSYPGYFISKNKIQLDKETNIQLLFSKIKAKYHKQEINTIDGLKIEFDSGWIHLRTSNTEPIIRIYAESQLETTANNLGNKIIEDIKNFMKEKS